MSINSAIQPNRPNIAEIFQKLQSEDYFIDRSFQRNLVWTEKQKVRLIETILTGFPMPEIYLWEQPINVATGSQRYSIVDGQQRTNAIFTFLTNEYSLKKSYLDDDNISASFTGKKWFELCDDDKAKVFQYIINVRHIPTYVTMEQIKNIFRRLNETDKALNPQELRHAAFSGKFLSAASDLASNIFFEENKIFSINQVRRMVDVQFISSLLIYLREGVVTENRKIINEVYERFNDHYEYREKDIQTVENFLGFWNGILDLGVNHLVSIFSKTVHVFPLFVIFCRCSEHAIDLPSTEEIIEFATEYEAQDWTQFESEKAEMLSAYKLASQQGTTGKPSRMARIELLSRFILRGFS
ncbi:MAG: DUF262 domain-containing protein [Pseudomonadota bacterium]